MTIKINLDLSGSWYGALCATTQGSGLPNGLLAQSFKKLMPQFNGIIEESDASSHTISQIQEPGRMLRISPYPFLLDLFTSIKRFFLGVEFNSDAQVNANSDPWGLLTEGRRLSIFFPRGESRAEIRVEASQKNLAFRICEAVSSCF